MRVLVVVFLLFAGTAFGQQPTPYDDKLVAEPSLSFFWKLDEPAMIGGIAQDSSASNYDGVYQGTISGGLRVIPESDGPAASMTQNSDYVSSASPDSLSGDFTVMVWGQLTDTLANGFSYAAGTGYAVWRHGDEKGANIYEDAGGNVVVEMVLFDPTTFTRSVAQAVLTINPTDPHHYVYSYSATDDRMRVYVDGVLEDEVTGIVPFGPVVTAPWWLGRTQQTTTTNDYWRGRFQSFSMIKRELTPAEVGQYYLLGAAGAEFRRGDVINDGVINIADFFAVLNIFSGVPVNCFEAADADDSGTISTGDAFIILNYAFSSGSPPAAPFPTCGFDPNFLFETISCRSYVGPCP